MDHDSTMRDINEADRLNGKVMDLLSESEKVAKDEEKLTETIAMLEFVLACAKKQEEETKCRHRALEHRIRGYLQAVERHLYYHAPMAHD